MRCPWNPPSLTLAYDPSASSDPKLASSRDHATPSRETRTSSGVTEDGSSPSSASSLESARLVYNSIASSSGDAQEPSQESHTQQQKRLLSSLKPTPRYLVAELERMGVSRDQAIEAVSVAYIAAGEEFER